MSKGPSVELIFYRDALNADEFLSRFNGSGKYLPLLGGDAYNVIDSLPRRKQRPWEIEHQRRTAENVLMLGTFLKIPESELLPVARAAEQHDLGKETISEAISEKTGSLTPNETLIMRAHSSIGVYLARRENILETEEELGYVAHHHEKWDGSGYPEGLKGSELSVKKQILGLSDWIDAVKHERPYKVGYTDLDIVNMLSLMLKAYDQKVEPGILTRRDRKILKAEKTKVLYNPVILYTAISHIRSFK